MYKIESDQLRCSSGRSPIHSTRTEANSETETDGPADPSHIRFQSTVLDPVSAPAVRKAVTANSIGQRSPQHAASAEEGDGLQIAHNIHRASKCIKLEGAEVGGSASHVCFTKRLKGNKNFARLRASAAM